LAQAILAQVWLKGQSCFGARRQAIRVAVQGTNHGQS